jgi:hypothetical protein
MDNKYDALLRMIIFLIIPYFAMFIAYVISFLLSFPVNMSVMFIMCAGMAVSLILIFICAKDIWDSLKK